MRIPSNFKTLQQTAFQDKTIYHHPVMTSTDALGGHYSAPAAEAVNSYQVNAQVLSDALTAQEYGLRLGRDIQITSSQDLPIAQGDYVKWDGRTYAIVGILPRDSHVVLLGEAIG